jgi:hypothetical protein
MIIDCQEKGLNYILEKLSGKKTPEEKIRAIWEGIVSWGLENEDRFLFLMQHQRASFIKEETRAQIEAKSQALCLVLSEAREKKILCEIPMELMGELMMSLFEGTISFFRKNRELFDKIEYREYAYLMFYNAITK